MSKTDSRRNLNSSFMREWVKAGMGEGRGASPFHSEVGEGRLDLLAYMGGGRQGLFSNLCIGGKRWSSHSCGGG